MDEKIRVDDHAVGLEVERKGKMRLSTLIIHICCLELFVLRSIFGNDQASRACPVQIRGTIH